jgi:hypothetical protein
MFVRIRSVPAVNAGEAGPYAFVHFQRAVGLKRLAKAGSSSFPKVNGQLTIATASLSRGAPSHADPR